MAERRYEKGAACHDDTDYRLLTTDYCIQEHPDAPTPPGRLSARPPAGYNEGRHRRADAGAAGKYRGNRLWDRRTVYAPVCAVEPGAAGGLRGHLSGPRQQVR